MRVGRGEREGGGGTFTPAPVDTSNGIIAPPAALETILPATRSLTLTSPEAKIRRARIDTVSVRKKKKVSGINDSVGSVVGGSIY